MGIASYIIINLVLFLTHLLLAYKWLKPKGRSISEVLVGGVLSALVQVVVTVVILGLLIRRLYAPEIFWSNIALCIIFNAVARVRPKDAWRFIVDLAEWIAKGWKVFRKDAVLSAFGLLLLLLFAWLMFMAVVFPPYSWDSLAFHLAAPGYWLQDGRMGTEPPYPAFDPYPRNISIFYFFMLVFLRNDLLVNCINLALFVPMGMLAILIMARHSGRRRNSSLLAGMLFFTFPIVIHQSTTCYIDLGSSCLFLASLAFLLKPRIEFCDVVYGGLGLGLFVGSKGNAPFFIIGALIPIIIYHLPHLRRRVGIKRVLGWAIAGFICILISGFWVYGNNWVKFGNPAYPFAVKPFGIKMFGGELMGEFILTKAIWKDNYEPLMERTPLERVYYSWSEPQGRYVYDMRLGGFGPMLFVLLLPCLGAALVISALRRKGLTFFPLLTLLAAFCFFPQGIFWVRYNIFMGALFCLALAYIIDITRLSSMGKLLNGVVLVLTIITLFLGTENNALSPSYLKYFLVRPVRLWHSSQLTTGGGFERELFRKIYSLSRPGSVTAIDKTYLWRITYPLWNRNFSNRVVYVDMADKQTWLKGIEDSGANMLAIGTDGDTYNWASSQSGRFELIMRGGRLSLFKVLPTGQTGAVPGPDG